MKWKKIIFFLVLPVSAFILILGGFFTHKIRPGNVQLEMKEVKGVKLLKIQGNQYQSTLSVPGTVVSQENTTISSKIMATVKNILVKKGQIIHKGEPLLLLDSSQVAATADQAKAGIAVAQATQQTVDQSIKVAQSAADQVHTQIQQANAALQAAQAQFTNAKTNFDRISGLLAAGAASQQDYDNAKTNYTSAQAAVDKATANVDSAEAAYKQALQSVAAAKSRIGETDAQIQQAGAAYASASISQSDATILAPFDGKFIDTLVNIGDMASPGLPLVKVEKPPYYLEVYLDESKQNNIHLGDKIPVTIGTDKKTLTGTVAEIVPHVDPNTRKFKVKILLPSSQDIVSGMYGEAAVPDGSEKGMFVPESAIVRWSQFTGVFVVDDKDITHLRYVNLGRSQNGNVEVLSGLNVGDKVVISPVDKITDQEKVVPAS
ncbi:efflux RND transporter periplasmic adaptor subunit [Fodinisporobacter ferrooxydans]|uniref:Efflux RND transporter periplasmic adaptor subunit n=1 Tax=Fodinisporobacter ferrooxydans TaxID=2901836 RepID=A0ABY4CQL8_9BACL|nr:efflux RND transporter periplasmic adaptor subunit [Alicyclobacillaceae bacterium MYW30-H2]